MDVSTLKVAILSDIHADYQALFEAAERAVRDGAAALFQVGDFGWFPRLLKNVRWKELPNIPIYALDGNHEDFDFLEPFLDQPHPGRVFPGCPVQYVPRGVVVNVLGLKVACCGGAGSIDKHWRRDRTDEYRWHWQEEVTEEQADRLAGLGLPDLMLTHSPGQGQMDMYGHAGKRYFGVSDDWKTPTPGRLDDAWKKLGRPMWLSGHMHTPHEIPDIGPRVVLAMGEYRTVTLDSEVEFS